ncbi:Kinetochore Mis14 [Penicillium macrosclerotiorum]|uniref:Kinetochore Mis14 n=1 Tax=Penicillium macrosclerotiorum TaxID=303699 RepID=UPI002548D21D|nr:Kinetochore Mis14 [Penicillium macrosclerotiorum]KAJ5683394.1 Kinetochore Mis14 [Penicillium macrosclerotiorum]
MAEPHYRKIELQSPTDFTYLYANTIALSRQKLDLHLPPSATNNDAPDPMRERVRELVDEYITRTFTSASSSISINGIDSTSPQFPFPASFTAPETVEYEPFDSELASRVSTLYAQLESLTTSVAQLRRETPQRAAQEYAARLEQVIKDEVDDDDEEEGESVNGHDDREGMDETKDESHVGSSSEQGAKDVESMEVDTEPQATTKQRPGRTQRRRNRLDPAWTLQVPLGTNEETERWRSGDIAEVYENTLRALQRLQGEGDVDTEAGAEGNALATTMGKAERAGRAAEVVENM